jgi:acetyl-CoA carboxylase biotin carboxylase subunit
MPNTPASKGRIFVANRGEIALRAVRAAKALGMESVLGVSQADRDSMAAREANRVVVLGPPRPRDSYLNMNLIVHAAKATGCTALYPGYGFLSERSEFAELCEKEGIAFVGPTAESIRSVGDKLSARALAKSAKVPLTEGSDKLPDVEAALKVAAKIGYPVLTKASAGGGGRGMVIARNEAELKTGFDQASTIAKEAFGEGTLFLERYVEVARHIEVQVMGDGAGNVIHFGERDCSIQRRYQKMIEEAPAPILPEAVRKRLHASAISLLSSIKYRNAGTVEFLYDVKRQEFSFMEVNARIQVEHPVSEEISGVDLVQTQLKIASGVIKTVKQDDVNLSGHAIEARIIAEDSSRDFMPSPGRVTEWTLPSGEGVRVDTAVETGTMIPPFYDSMIAKLIVKGKNRDEAVERLIQALANFRVSGIATNIPLLGFIAAHPDFRNNNFNTRWLETTLLPAFRAK